jgi:hypothetical protein
MALGGILIPDQHHPAFLSCLAASPVCQWQTHQTSHDGPGTGTDEITTCYDTFFSSHADFFLLIRRPAELSAARCGEL